MACILDNSDKLSFRCDPGCYFDENKYVRCLWCKTPSCPKNIELPKCIAFYIRLNIDDKDLFQDIGRWIYEFNDDDIFVETEGVMLTNLIKDEYKDDYKLGFEDYKCRVAKLQDLISEIAKLNLGNDLNGIQDSTNIYRGPDTWYIKTYINSTYIVCCHSDTRFYSWLKDNGILDKYLPISWYT